MEARLRVLASGSSGNAVFAAFGATRFLIDAGISLPQLRQALAEIGERADELSAVIVTHEHADHISGLNAFRSRWEHVPILATAGTSREIGRRQRVCADGQPLVAGEAICLGDVRVTPFTVDHDAAEPVGLRLDWGDFALGVATDLGAARPHVEAMLGGCRVLVLEANHDEDMLLRGPYPEFLKRRIASTRGHLSNRQSAALLAKVVSPSLEHVVLAHLSSTNNTPQQAIDEVSAVLGGRHSVRVEAAQPFAPGPLRTFKVMARPLPDPRVPATSPSRAHRSAPTALRTPPRQPRLFD